MKKFTLILTVLFAITIHSNAQIPNNGFENWVTVGNFIEPTNWHSMYSLMDSSGNWCPVARSTDHYPTSVGSYSVKIMNDVLRWNTGIPPDNFLGWGMLLSTKLNDKPLFPVTGHPNSLCGYYKFLPLNGDTMNIYIHFYKNGVEITNGKFQSSVTTTNWTSFKIFVTDTLYSSVDSARISLEACNEPKSGQGGPHGNSVLYIDNLSFDSLITSSPTSVAEASSGNTLFNLYPNPASDNVTLNINNSNNAYLTLTIYDVMGKLVRSESLPQNHPQIHVGDLNNGIYVVAIKSPEWMGKQKLIIQK